MSRTMAPATWGCLVAALVAVAPVALRVPGAPLSGSPPFRAAAAAQEAPLATAVPPSWTFAVYAFRDPYEGPIRQPPLPGTRVVGAEVEIANTSDTSLTVYLNNLRLHTDIDVTYPSGLVVGVPETGAELAPKLVEGVVEPGQRTRGWVWWRIPEGEALEEIVFFPSPPPPSVVPLPLDAAPTAG